MGSSWGTASFSPSFSAAPPSLSSSCASAATEGVGEPSNSRTPRSSSFVTMLMSRANVSNVGMPFASSGRESFAASVATASVPPGSFES